MARKLNSAERLELAHVLARFASFLRRLATTGDRNLTTLSTLASLASYGDCRLTDLATREGLTQPAMTQLVSRLVDEGLVERRPGRDRRVVNVRITSAGQQLLADRWAAWDERIAEVFGGLPPEDQGVIWTALPALRRFVSLGPDEPLGTRETREAPERSSQSR